MGKFNEGKLIGELARLLSEDAEIEAMDVAKNNGTTLRGLVIKEPGTNVYPTLYPCDFPDGLPAGELARQMAERYELLKMDGMFDLDFLRDWDRARELVTIRLVNREKNRELLEDAPHVPFLDLECVFTVTFTGEDMNASSVIRNAHMGMWGIDARTLYAAAKANTPKNLGADLKNLPDFLNDMAGETFPDAPDPSRLMYVLTNRPRTYGASCLVDMENIRGFADRFEKDVFILPSSVHEVMFLCDDGRTALDELSALVREVNEAQLGPDEVLSDHAYKYIRETGEITW